MSFHLDSYSQFTKQQFIDSDELTEREQQQSRWLSFTESTYTNNYDVKYYRLNFAVNPDTLYIQGNVTTFFIPNQNISEIVFDLNSILTIDSILYRNQHITFTHFENRITISQNFIASQLDSVTIYYQGQPPITGTSFKADQHNGVPIIWTLSEPYGAMDWWPCKQSLTDKADSVDMYVTVPRENKVAGVGNLISEITHGNLLTTYWKSRYPIVPYLVAIAVTPYSEISFNTSLTTGSLFVQNYVYKEDSASVIDQLLATDVLLRYYDSLIGPYPFMKEKYGHAQFGRGGGMEHQTMSFMTHFGFALNAHEMAHQWFGDKITCGSWSDIWLNEGFATYFAGLPLETMYNGDYWMDWKKRYLERATQEPDGSVYVEDTTDVGRIFNPYLSYAKGGYVLHMLRSQIGDSSFFAGIKSYANDPKLSYKTALTGDLFRHMEQSSGTDLSVYKNQWIYGKGFPSYNLEWEQSGLELQFRLSQTTSDASIPFFYLKVPILLQGEHGEQYWITINPETNGQEFRFTVPFQVVKVNIDPNLDIISKANFVINTASLTDVHIYPNPAVNFLTIAPGGDFKRVTGYQIISSDGKIIQQTSGLNNSFSWTINLETCSHGTYRIIIYSDEKSITKGFVVTR